MTPSDQCVVGIMTSFEVPRPSLPSFRNEIFLSFFFTKAHPEAIGSRIRFNDGGWRLTDGGWRLTDGGWPMTYRSYMPAGVLRRFECTGPQGPL